MLFMNNREFNICMNLAFYDKSDIIPSESKRLGSGLC